MSHSHDVIDDDSLFTINSDTREIIYLGEKEPILIQGDHNSERFAFEVDKFIDGHDVLSCNRIRIHFINISADNPLETNPSIYYVDDMAVSKDDPTKVRFSWLISRDATMLVGTLSFVVEFMCINDQNIVDYSWHSGFYTGCVIAKGMDNSDAIIGEHYEVLSQWILNIENAGNVETAKVLERINSAVKQAENDAKSEIDAHADTVRQDLTAYGLDVSKVITHVTGTNKDKVMSQYGATQMREGITVELSELDTRISSLTASMNDALFVINGQIHYEGTTVKLEDFGTQMAIYVARAPKVKIDGVSYWDISLNIQLTDMNNSGNNIYASFNKDTLPNAFIADGYSRHIVMQYIGYTIKDSKAEIEIKIKINGNEYTLVKDSSISDNIMDIASISVPTEGIPIYKFDVDPSAKDLFGIVATGIKSIDLAGTSTVDGAVTHTYKIQFTDGTYTTFDVKDGVGIIDIDILERGDYSDTYEIWLSNDRTVKFSVPNNNSVGIVTEDSGDAIQAKDLIPLRHIIKVHARSKNMITYPYPYSYGLVNGVTFTPNDDGSITANGTVADDGTSANVMVSKTLKLVPGKTYYVGNSENLLLEYKDETGTTKYVKNRTITWKKEYEFIRLYIQYSPKVVVDNDTIYPMFCESDVAVNFTPYVDTSSMILTRCGKNLLPPPVNEAGKTKYGVTLTDNGDGTITMNGTATNNTAFTLYTGSMRLKGTYTLSGMTGGSGETYYIQPVFGESVGRGLVEGYIVYEDLDCVLTEVKITIAAGASLDNVKIALMLEPGAEPSDFEEYRGDDYTFYSDGTTTQIVDSFDDGSNVNLVMNKNGVVIDARYNVDQTKAFRKINTLLETLLNGGV